MHNQVSHATNANYGINANRYGHAKYNASEFQNVSADRASQTHRSYRDIHDSYLKPPPALKVLTQVGLPEKAAYGDACLLKAWEASIKAQEQNYLASGGVEGVLGSLREKFGIPISILGSEDDRISGLWGGNQRNVSISEEMLRQMAYDPEKYRDITEMIQRWLNGSSEFMGKVGGKVDSMHLSISEHGIICAYNESSSVTTAAERDVIKAAWKELIDYLMSCLDERDGNYKAEEKDNHMVTITESTAIDAE